MQDILQTFLEQPSAGNYRAARQAILLDPEYRGDRYRAELTRLAQVAELCDRGDLKGAARLIESMLPEWALSPRLHCYAAWIAESGGDAEETELEQFLATSCLQGLLATGDGSPRRPYLVMHVSDEYDVLDWLGLRCQSQQLVARQGRLFDVLTVDADRELWFEIGEDCLVESFDLTAPAQAARVFRRSLRDFSFGGRAASDRMLRY